MMAMDLYNTALEVNLLHRRQQVQLILLCISLQLTAVMPVSFILAAQIGQQRKRERSLPVAEALVCTAVRLTSKGSSPGGVLIYSLLRKGAAICSDITCYGGGIMRDSNFEILKIY